MKMDHCRTAMAKCEISLTGAKLKLQACFSVGLGFAAVETRFNPMSQCQMHWLRRR